jgi:apolipoprotein D and lipocalin family protein
MKNWRKWVISASAAAAAALLGGCPSYGPAPATVPHVDLTKYVGLWHEIASNPAFFNKNLVAVTAEYTANPDGTINVLNKGHANTANGPESSITGTARVVDTVTNSKLSVQFSVPFGWLFRGKYWIVYLDDQNYQYAVVTDNRQATLFVLSRDPAMSTQLYNTILTQLQANHIDTTRLRITGGLTTP